MKNKILIFAIILIMPLCIFFTGCNFKGCDSTDKEKDVTIEDVKTALDDAHSLLNDAYDKNVGSEATAKNTLSLLALTDYLNESPNKDTDASAEEAQQLLGLLAKEQERDIEKEEIDNYGKIVNKILLPMPQGALLCNPEFDKVYTQKDVDVGNDITSDFYFKFTKKKTNIAHFSYWCETSNSQTVSVEFDIYIDYKGYEYIVNGAMFGYDESESCSVFFVNFSKIKDENKLNIFELAQIQVAISFDSFISKETITKEDINTWGTVVESVNFNTGKYKYVIDTETSASAANIIKKFYTDNSNYKSDKNAISVNYYEKVLEQTNKD